ncbi:26S proteasome non-ATPase regulatory subunit 14 [Histomonas meleagridis]|uniref:26S proteasome non-ATPase regulatory subunit 14 n=1 Tax=Histomonas meleagridis TaxID=135588 RepID=UPI003559F98C|nr:26S proteasome non-ATPase regulatory subunit 14 [Histomonas meleagridis]KAH0798562.1 26S proteasome non-ATPase regulatory subunit 14 [Histomonas meleagridis]
MLKHGKAGIPLEVIGIMLGHKIDEFTIEIFDVFPTPQIATGISVETTDEKFQYSMMRLLEQSGYNDLVSVGWYHSHPGFDVWLSDVDCANQDSQEKLDQRAVAVVVDPVLSVRGKVVIGAFRNIPRNPLELLSNKPIKIQDPREKTSFIGHTVTPSAKTQKCGLNLTFYEMPIVFKMNEHEQHMLQSLHRPTWSTGFEIPSFQKNDKKNLEILKNLTATAENYRKSILEEATMKKSDYELRHVGKVDPKQFIKENTNALSAQEAALLARLHVTKSSF